MSLPERDEDTPLVPVTKRVNVKARGKVMGMAREHYLRSDLPCQSVLCFEGCSQGNCESKDPAPLLPGNVTHYLLPLEDVAKSMGDILDIPELTGIIFLQSVINAVQLQSMRHYRKLYKLIKNPDKSSIFFPNEFCKQTHIPRETGQSLSSWKTLMAYRAANWFYDHLGGQKPIVIITEDDEIIKQLKSKRVEIFVLKFGDYLQNFWPSLETAQEMYKSLVDSKDAVKKTRDSDDYVDYLKLEVLEAGIKSGRYIQGKLNVNKHHAMQEAFVTRQGGDLDKKDGSSGDILIPGMVYRNRAVHGDLVVVQLLAKSEWKSKITRLAQKKDDEEVEEVKWEKRADVEPTGRIIGIIERNWRECIATIPKEEAENVQRKSGKRILVMPYDRRIPKIRVLTTQAKKLAGERIVVRIDNWPVNSQYPNGHFVKSLGKIGDLETEIDGILLENNISITPFSQGILSEMPPEDWKPDKDLGKRKDLRQSHMVMSIDPKDCEDVDDTLSVRKLNNGNLEIGVHIADVTHFVPMGSLTDLEARRRATTVYLADRRYDMLPSVLSANVCSLLGGVDRYAVSVLWELDPSTYQVISVWYGRTLIRSSYKLFYEAAQDIINGKSAEEMKPQIPELSGFSGQGLQKKFKQLRDKLLLLSRIAQKIQDNREKDGALQLESTEVQFEFQESSLDDIKPKEHLKIHETVAECMIFANHWVAKKIAKVFPHQSLLRNHPPPKKENFEELKKCATSKGWKVNVWSNKVLAESLNECQDEKDPVINFLMRSLATYAMVQAAYFSTGSVKQEEWDHYGLALKQYTHFTSPIRRYADIIVHRLLLAALENQDWWSDADTKLNKEQMMPNSELQTLSHHINDRNRAAQNAARSSQTLFQTLYFKGKEVDDPRCIVEGVVFSIRANGFLVYIPKYALKGPVYLQNQKQESQVLFHHENHGPMFQSGLLWNDEHSINVETVDGVQTYRLFDHVTITIQMVGSDAHANKLNFYLLSNKPPSSNVSKMNLDEGEINFLKEIRKDQEDEKMDEDEVEPLADLEADSGRKKGGKRKNFSMYDFFQDQKRIGRSIEK